MCGFLVSNVLNFFLVVVVCNLVCCKSMFLKVLVESVSVRWVIFGNVVYCFIKILYGSCKKWFGVRVFM